MLRVSLKLGVWSLKLCPDVPSLGSSSVLPTAPASWTGQSPNLSIPCSTLEDSAQLSSNLLKPSPVGFSFFLQNLGHLRGGPHLRFSVLLDFQIHHLFDQSGQRLRIHQFLSPDCIKISPDSNISVSTLDTVVRSSAQIRGTAEVAPRRRLKNPTSRETPADKLQKPHRARLRRPVFGLWPISFF